MVFHINAESQRRFGIRYFEAYQTKSNVNKSLDGEAEIVKVCCEKNTPLQKKIYGIRAIYLGKKFVRRSNGIFKVAS